MENETVSWWVRQHCSIVLPGQGPRPLEPYPYQVALWEDESRQRIVLKSRQMGVSRALACEAACLALQRPGSTILLVSRSLAAARNLLRYCRQSIAPAIAAGRLPRPTVTNTTTMEWEKTDSRIVSLSASIDAARSYSATDVYLDEAAYLPWAEEIYQSLAPTVSNGGRMTIVSTPHGRGNLFHRLWEESNGEWRMENGEWGEANGQWGMHRVHWSQRPEYTATWAERERRRHTSRSWAEEYELSFEDSGLGVFAEASIRALTRPGAAEPQPPYFAGLDLARWSDFTALLVLDSSGMVVGLERFNQASWMIQVDRVVRALAAYPGCHALVDATGAGDAVFGLLEARVAASVPSGDRRARPAFTVEPFIYTTSTRSVLMDELILAVEGCDIGIPTAEIAGEADSRTPLASLLAEMRTFRWEVGTSGRAAPRHPPGGHDDCVQALALAWRALQRHRARTPRTFPALTLTGVARSPAALWSNG